LKNGREIIEDALYFPGMPQRLLSAEQLWDKFNLLTTSLPLMRARSIFDGFQTLEAVQDVTSLRLS
jgi:hypothetical protein